MLAFTDSTQQGTILDKVRKQASQWAEIPAEASEEKPAELDHLPGWRPTVSSLMSSTLLAV